MERNQTIAPIESHLVDAFERHLNHSCPVSIHKYFRHCREDDRHEIGDGMQIDILMHPRNNRLSRITASHIRSNSKCFMETNIRTIRRINEIEVPPMRIVQNTRSNHFRTRFERQIDFAEMTQGRIKREAVQILHYSYSPSMRLCTPTTFECLFNSLVDYPLTKYLAIISEYE